jgi:large subunit ribosomal protein L23
MALTAFDIVKNVRITEKGTILADKYNKFTLRVDPRANAIEVKKAVEELFKVKVTKVNTSNFFGKSRRQQTKAAGKSSDWKKAVVTLKKGDKIELQ